MGNDRITLIITTRYLPYWRDDELRLDWDVDLLDIPDQDIRSVFRNNPCAKTDSFGNYDVFVVPCLDNEVDGVTLEKKGEYLEKILSLYCPNNKYENLYFCAHDKDFKVNGDVYGDFVKKDNIPCDGCNQLLDLVDRKHAYMFAHDKDKSAVGKIVMQLPDVNGFGAEECAVLIGIIDAEREMNDFFTSVDSNLNNTYPKVL